MNPSNIIDDNVYTNILNLYIQHYKKTYPEKTITSMFDGINVDDFSSTNHMLESLYEEMIIYKGEIQSSNLVGLSIDGKIIEKANNVIKLLLTLNELINNDNDKHKNTNWIIINLK
jgi:hypothetical protein